MRDVEAADLGNARRHRELNQLELDDEPDAQRLMVRTRREASLKTDFEKWTEDQANLFEEAMEIVKRATAEGRYLSAREASACDEIMAEMRCALRAAKRAEWEKIHGPSSLGIH